MKELLEICTALEKLGGQPCAMATVIHVDGSAYRRPGARMLITPSGQSWGIISGGCLEYDIFHQARGVLESGSGRIVRYDSTSDDDLIFGTGLGCNGIIDVFIEPVTDAFRKAFIATVQACQRTRQECAIAILVEQKNAPTVSGAHAFLGPKGWSGDERLKNLPPDFFSAGKAAIISRKIAGDEIRVFVQPLLPALQLVIFGGWLDVIPLVRMAKESGFQTTVVDARLRESSRTLFQEADEVFLGSPSAAVSQIQFDDRTVAVLMNHNFEQDREALTTLAQISPPFVGLLGSVRRKERILEAVQNDGVLLPDEFEQRLHAPVGLDIGADTPAEIAVAIMAEILTVLNQRSGRPIRDRLLPLANRQPEPIYA